MTDLDDLENKAREAIADMDDCARMSISVDPVGPRETLGSVILCLIERVRKAESRIAEFSGDAADPEALHIAYLHGQADRNQTIAKLRQQLAEAQAENARISALMNAEVSGLSTRPPC